MKKWLYGGFTLLIVFLLYIAGVLVYGTMHDWQPPDRMEAATLQQAGTTTPIPDTVLSLAIWNVGYGGLGAESDFFYDQGGTLLSGGKTIRAEAGLVDKNINGMEQFVEQTRADFFLFQEVDSSSRRSYYANQIDSIRQRKPDYGAWFAANYRAAYVPVPLLEFWRAYGQTHSGLLSLSRFRPATVERLQLPGEFGWPTRLFQLDRCALLQRFPTACGPELVVVNVHLSAFDDKGTLKHQQMGFLKQLAEEEYSKGNFVIIGGDWNLVPPFLPYDVFSPGKTQGYSQINISPELLPGDWTWIYDATVPTNRKVRIPYEAGKSFTTIIDFYLISPNVQARQVKTIDQQFRFSDHQPVYLEVDLSCS